MGPPYGSLSGSTTLHSDTETFSPYGAPHHSAGLLSLLVGTARTMPKAHLTHNCDPNFPICDVGEERRKRAAGRGLAS